MNKEFIPVLQALELKELGYREQTLAYYSNDFNPNGEFELRFSQDSGDTIDWNEPDEDGNYISAPLYQQVFRWFREKYGWIGGVRQLSHQSINGMLGEFTKDKDNSFMMFGKSYEEIELRCLKELIGIAKESKPTQNNGTPKATFYLNELASDIADFVIEEKYSGTGAEILVEKYGVMVYEDEIQKEYDLVYDKIFHYLQINQIK